MKKLMLVVVAVVFMAFSGTVMAAGELVLFGQAGAYGFAMSSNYNGRLRPAEVLVLGSEFAVVRRRQRYEHLLDGTGESPIEIGA